MGGTDSTIKEFGRYRKNVSQIEQGELRESEILRSGLLDPEQELLATPFNNPECKTLLQIIE